MSVQNQLAEALKTIIDQCNDGSGFTEEAAQQAEQALTDHEAAKAATPDDVMEAVAFFKSPSSVHEDKTLIGPMAFKSILAFMNAALRQGVTLPEVVTVDDAFRAMEMSPHYPDAVVLMKRLQQKYPNGLRIVKGGA